MHEATHDRLVWGMRQNRDKAVAGVPEWEELREQASLIKEHTLTHLDRYLEEFETNATKLGTHLGVVRSPLGVAEAGAIWLTQAELVVNALGVLSQHLVVLLDQGGVVETMHDAYAQIDLAASPYGVFLAGPSATGDIEGVIIHGAQGRAQPDGPAPGADALGGDGT